MPRPRLLGFRTCVGVVAIVCAELGTGPAAAGSAAEKEAAEKAKATRHSFVVGGQRFVILNVGEFTFDVAKLLAAAPPGALEAAGETGSAGFEIHALFVDTGSHRVIVDPGGFGPDRLLGALREAGIDPVTVDTVVITHGHVDHYGGAADAKGQPTFPKARYYVQRTEWESWHAAESPEPRHAEAFRRALGPLRERFTLLEGDGEIVPGLRAQLTPGHSPGHMVVWFGKEVVYTGDVLFHAQQFPHPEWTAEFDVRKEQVAASRRRLLQQLAAEDALVVTTHLRMPGMGRVRAQGDGWRWVPDSGAASD